MNPNDIETLLRKAPRPTAPPGLLDQLQSDIPRQAQAAPDVASPRRAWRDWLRGWYPALAYALAMLVCVTLLAVQAGQIAELRRENEKLRAASENLSQLHEGNVDYARLAEQAGEAAKLRKSIQDLARWREEAARLRGQVADLAALRAENQRLSAERAAAQTAITDEEDPMAAARKEGLSAHCIGNIKQLGLGARIYAGDNNGVMPPDFITISNELGSPNILVCPADSQKVALKLGEAVGWASLTDQNISYEFLARGVSETNSPNLVLFRCPIHGHVGCLDGSAHRAQNPTNSSGWLIQRDGYYYLP